MKSGELRVESSGKREEGGFGWSSIACVLFLVTLYSLLSTSAAAQDDPPDLVPPPQKIISREERASLDAKTDTKGRTKLALELMNLRLASAERLNSAADFDGVFRELGAFHGLMDNGLDYLQKRDSGGDKILDNFKRIEIGLRGFGPRIEKIRRDLPIGYEAYVRKLIKSVREARTKATEPLFADTVVPVRKPDR